MAAAPGGRLIAAAGALVAVVIWGGWFPVTRLGVLDGSLTPMDMVVLRCSVGAFVLAPIVLRRGLKAGRAGWLGSLAILVTLSGPFAYAVGVGARYAPAAHAAIFIPGTFPAMVFVVGLLFFHDPATPRRWLGLASVAGGVGLVAVTAFAAEAGGMLAGYAWFHACAWMWVVYTLVVRHAGMSAAHALGVTHVLALLVYGPVWLIVGDSGLVDLPWQGVLFQVVYHGLLNGVVAMFLYNYAVQRLGAAEGAVFAALVPCAAAVSAWPILGEAIGPAEGVALVAVALGVYLISGATPRTAKAG